MILPLLPLSLAKETLRSLDIACYALNDDVISHSIYHIEDRYFPRAVRIDSTHNPCGGAIVTLFLALEFDNSERARKLNITVTLQNKCNIPCSQHIPAKRHIVHSFCYGDAKPLFFIGGARASEVILVCSDLSQLLYDLDDLCSEFERLEAYPRAVEAIPGMLLEELYDFKITAPSFVSLNKMMTTSIIAVNGVELFSYYSRRKYERNGIIYSGVKFLRDLSFSLTDFTNPLFTTRISYKEGSCYLEIEREYDRGGEFYEYDFFDYAITHLHGRSYMMDNPT